MVLVTILHTLLSSVLETDASSGFRVQPYTLGLTTSEWALTKHIPIRDPNIVQGNVTPENHFTIDASQGHLAPRKEPTGASCDDGKSRYHKCLSTTLFNMHSPAEPCGVLHVFVCIVGRCCPYLAFRPHMARWAIVSTTPRHAVIDAHQSVNDNGRRA